MTDLLTPEAPVATSPILKRKSKGTPLPEPVVFVGNDKSVGLTNQRSGFMGYVCDAEGEPIFRRDPYTGNDVPIVKEYKFPYVVKTQEELAEFENVMANQSGNDMEVSIKRLDGIDAAYYLKHHQQVDLYGSSSQARAAASEKAKGKK